MYWKTRFGRCIHQTEDIKVYQNAAYRWLTFSSRAIQTLINRRHPERMELSYLHALSYMPRKTPGPTCVLGLGGGGIAHALAPILKTTPLVAVEHNQAIISLGDTFFMTHTLQNLEVLHLDANDFVKQSSARYQHLLIDLFNDKAFPEHCNTRTFFESCKERLLPGGVLAVNLASLNDQRPILEHIRECFPNKTVLLPIRKTTNLVILAFHGDSINPLLNQLQQDKALKNLTWSPVWGHIAVFR